MEERERERVRREREREEQRERERREREREEQRERERREREKEEKRKQEAAERERERERRDKERREMERREMERERLLHHNRQAMNPGRDRSPLRNGSTPIDTSEVRVKEEPRSKDDDIVMLPRPPPQGPGPLSDARYHPHPHSHSHPPHPHSYLARHSHSMQHSLSRGMMPTLTSHPMQHFPPPPSATQGGPWPGDPFRDAYRYDLQQLRYNPLMAAAYRAEEEERAKIYAGYAPPPVNPMRSKGPSPGPLSNLHMHHRAGPGPGVPVRPLEPSLMHNDIHKKEDASQSR